jgi:hypothetical protein
VIEWRALERVARFGAGCVAKRAIRFGSAGASEVSARIRNGYPFQVLNEVTFSTGGRAAGLKSVPTV